ncbi:GGDEF domain-containing protein [Paraburkholderia agricolaris]|uniref:GGDEF domain-containing protein n=1 Tax=Paraburkholderia agricolaris TaxID=2152888 RepID=UPI0012910739|nr:GGDEF domain-containing protein [Paraburkholderia agricolaris]
MSFALNATQIVQLVVPGVAVVFAFSFLCVWIYERQRFFLIALSASFLAFASGSASQILHLPDAWRPNALISATFYAASILLMSEGVLRRRGKPFHWSTGAFIFTAVIVGIYYFSYVAPDLLARIYVLNYCFGAVLVATALQSRSKVRTRLDDRALFWMLLAFGVSFFVRTALTTGKSLPHVTAQFAQTAFWLALQLSLALLGAVLALLLLTTAIVDLIERIIEERDRDFLTQALNRRAFERRGARFVGDLKRHPVTMVAYDLDHFKSINDSFGHAAGDTVLRAFCQIVVTTIRANDIVARIGGEEFVILLGNTGLSDAHVIAERIRLALTNVRFEKIAESLHVTVSAGVVQFQEGESLPVMLARADRLLYAAKRSGRNCTVSERLAEEIDAPEDRIA